MGVPGWGMGGVGGARERHEGARGVPGRGIGGMGGAGVGHVGALRGRQISRGKFPEEEKRMPHGKN